MHMYFEVVIASSSTCTCTCKYVQVIKLQLLQVVIMWPRTGLREGIHEKFRRSIHKDFCMHVAVGQT